MKTSSPQLELAQLHRETVVQPHPQTAGQEDRKAPTQMLHLAITS